MFSPLRALVLLLLVGLMVGTGCSSIAPPTAAPATSESATDATEAPVATTVEPSGTTSVATTSAPEVPDPGGFDLASLVDDYVADTEGGVDALIRRDGEVFRATNGTANDQDVPIGQGDAFRVGSLSKPFIATMVLQLVDEGAVDLDASIGQYLPEVAIGAEVTVAQLLSHRSGIDNYTAEQQFFIDALSDPERQYRPSEIVDYVVGSEVEADAAFSYSNTNYILLGQLIEQADGTSLNDSLAARIVRPLGLETTSFAVAGSPNPPVAPWSATANMSGAVDQSYDSIATGAWAAGSLISNVDDLSAFLAALFNGQLVSDEQLARMTDLGDTGYGLGIQQVSFSPDQQGFGHSGAIFGYLSTMAIDPNTGDQLIILTNNDALSPEGLAIEVLAAW